jgi:hypothetical protein
MNEAQRLIVEAIAAALVRALEEVASGSSADAALLVAIESLEDRRATERFPSFRAG